MIWEEINNFEDVYVVSNTGIVKRKDGKYSGTIKPLKLPRGYLYVILRNTKKKKYEHHYVHRLVAQAFIPNPQKLPCVNHKDGDKSNNRANNLEWCSYSHNSYHAWDSGLIPRQKTEQAKEKMSIGQKKYFKTHSPWNKGKRYHIKPKEKLQENDEK